MQFTELAVFEYNSNTRRFYGNQFVFAFSYSSY